MNDDQNPPVSEAPQLSQGPQVSGQNGKAAVIDKIQSASNILVAVSANPSIDQLSAAIAMTLLLEKFNKNATAVFSGKTPSAIGFLKPKERFEKTTDSLRDFIISIDKSKADKLRYKLEDDVVKIFITPYKTSITEKDLQYNAGDFNVDVIIALGVHHQQDLDTAITAHGRIFHDAVVVSINNEAGGDFGVANWENFDASSLSELIAELAQSIGQGMLDTDIATALLTGIVAETQRFSNAKTHPGTMNVSSVLLQAGADQQLVNQQLQSVIGMAVNLEAGSEIKPTEIHKDEPTEEPEELIVGDDGSLAAKTEDDGNELHIVQPDEDAAAPPDKEEEPAIPTPDLDFETLPSDPAAASEQLLGTAVEPTATPMLEDEPADGPITVQAPDAPVNQEPALPEIAANEPLKPFDPTLVHDAEIPPVPTEPDAPFVPAPVVQPGSGAFANLNNTPSFPSVAPSQTAHEQAPLPQSPADQAFTMPLPPPSAAGQPVAGPQYGQPFQAPAVQPQNGFPGTTPPPLPPPPVMPQ